MLHFESSLLALAGAAAAAGPIVIHLLNRRRFRPLEWAAMEFLRQAVERSRRILHLRDAILLALRVLAVVLVGAALARPYYHGDAWSAAWRSGVLMLGVMAVFGAAIWGAVGANRRPRALLAGVIGGVLAATFSAWMGADLLGTRADATAVARHQPVHAILLVDNSRSLGAEYVGDTLLEMAKRKAREFLAVLPAGSRTTVIPLAGSEDPVALDAFRHRDDSEKALDRLAAVDVAGDVRSGLERAVLAAEQAAELPAKRAVLLTDLQRSAFREADWGDLASTLGGLQIAPVSSDPPGNIWLADFHLEDGLASVESPCRFLARLESSGGTSAATVQLRLMVDGVEVSRQSVERLPGESRDIVFQHQIDGGADPERSSWSLVELELRSDDPSQDRLAADNRVSLVVPVAAALPVVFVDEYGGAEDPSRNRIGETYALRHLVAPKTASELDRRRLIRVIHLRQDQLTEDVLRTARLVVMAGVERPDACVTLLREFVQQGGPLVILAGGRFDPAAWQDLAWRDGRGVLPAPLRAEMHGVTPDEAPERLTPFYADFASMQHEFFLVEQEPPEQLAAIYESTPFFKAVQADVSDETLAALQEAESKQRADEEALAADSSRQADRQAQPNWWRWRTPGRLVARSPSSVRQGEWNLPRVLAEFKGNGLPFVIERRIGAGRVVLVTSGVTSDWNLLRVSGAMYLFHRMLFQLMEETFPVRNYETGQRIAFPVERPAGLRYVLTRPSGREEPLPVEALSSDVSGLQIRSPLVSGAYRIRAEEETSPESEVRAKSDEWVIAVNGPASESDLTRISPDELSRRIGRDDVRILGEDEPVDLQGGARRGQGLWQWILCGVLAVLLLEMLLLAWPALGEKGAS